MNSLVFKYITRFVVLVLVQVFVLNKIQFSGYINPYLYVLFILSLPFTTPKGLLLVLAFLMGLSIDFFSGMLGIHAAATVFMAYLRPGIIKLLGVKDDVSPELEPSVAKFDFLWYLTYSFILVFLHHLLLFYLEIFRFSEFFSTMGRVVISTVFTVTIIILVQYLFYRK
jgi:hypothetical protein